MGSAPRQISGRVAQRRRSLIAKAGWAGPCVALALVPKCGLCVLAWMLALSGIGVETCGAGPSWTIVTAEIVQLKGRIRIYDPLTLTQLPSSMPTQRAIELFAMLNFVIVGLSLLIQPRAWARYFAWMRREGDAGAVIYGLFCVLWGSLIVSFCLAWHGLLVVLPVFGIIQLLEGLIFLLAPAAGLKLMGMFTEEGSGLLLLRLLGVIAIGLAVYIDAIALTVGV